MLVPISQTRRQSEHENNTIRVSEANGKKTERNSAILSVSNNKAKELNRKCDKKANNFSCSKRPRTDRLESDGITVRADNSGIISQKDEDDPARCTSNETILKQTHGQESKRSGKRNLRSSLRIKCESSTSKAWVASCSSTYGGSDILGLYGLNPDLCDVTKHMDELVLSELLDGSQNSKTLPTKGKKSQGSTNDIMLSVRKAFSILPAGFAAVGDGNREDALCFLKPGDLISDKTNHVKMDKEKNIHESISELKDPHQAKPSISTLYQANEILECLALTPGQNLDILLLDLNLASDFSRSTMSQVTHVASLPYFLWSNCHIGGGCKSSADMVKLVSLRTPCTGRWFRIESNFTTAGDNNHCVFELLATFNSDKGPLIQQKSFDRSKHMSSCCKLPGEELPSGIEHVKDSPDNLRSYHDEHATVDDDQHTKMSCSCLGNFCRCHCKDALNTGNHNSRHLPGIGMSKLGHSPRALLAAEILCEMARCFKVSGLKRKQ